MNSLTVNVNCYSQKEEIGISFGMELDSTDASVTIWSDWIEEGLSDSFWENSYIFENSLNKVKDMLSDDKNLSCRDAIMKVFGSFDLHCELDGETIACEFDADVVMCSLLESCL